MKLKKAMKIFPIEFTPKNEVYHPTWTLGKKYITFTPDGWRAPFLHFSTEKEAVAWLIDGVRPTFPYSDEYLKGYHFGFTAGWALGKIAGKRIQ